MADVVAAFVTVVVLMIVTEITLSHMSATKVASP